MRILYRAGLDSGVAGHLSMRVVGEDAYWINSWGVFWDEVGPDDFVKMSFDLERVGGPTELPSFGSGFHTAVYRRRPDVGVICHVHSPFVIALAAKGQPLGMFDQRSPMFLDRMAVYEQRTQNRVGDSLFFGADEADGIADAFSGDVIAVLLTHHGAITVGPDVATAAMRALFLEECARTQIWAAALGAPEMPADIAAAYRRANEQSGRRLPSTWTALTRRLHRSDPDLFIDAIHATDEEHS
jgi:ribulose-5-phosphate 4-epimerase/fuculose-1-phosphate aldolase